MGEGVRVWIGSVTLNPPSLRLLIQPLRVATLGVTTTTRSLDRVKAGEFKSARAAAIEAGIIRPVPTVRLVDDPAKVAKMIQKHWRKDQITNLIEALLQ